jgi:hypothetical protein
MFLFKLGMEKFWGSVRILKIIFIMTLIDFSQTPLMTIFMTAMSKLAAADVANGENFYQNHFGLKQIPPLNL